jgi:phosphatidylserine/phosphatidylglycerophosphate/cardiolipin synthase-like enzyme
MAAAPAPADAALTVRFSPHGGAEALLIESLAAARSQVLVQAYSFTSMPIAQALKAGHDRGLDVRVILDRSQETQRHSELAFLLEAGVPVWVDAAHAIAHNKVMVIDGDTVLTGSFNFTRAAESANAENLLRIRDSSLAAAYRQNWEAHLAHSRRIQP